MVGEVVTKGRLVGRPFSFPGSTTIPEAALLFFKTMDYVKPPATRRFGISPNSEMEKAREQHLSAALLSHLTIPLRSSELERGQFFVRFRDDDERAAIGVENGIQSLRFAERIAGERRR